MKTTKIVESIKMSGNVKATLFKNGDFKKPIVVYDDHNTLYTAAFNYLAGSLVKTVTDAIDAPFTAVGTTPAVGYDGIILSVGGTLYSMKCTGEDPLNDSYTLGWSGENAARKFTGELTGVTGEITSLILGQDFQAPFTNQWATPSSWSSLTIANAADVLYVEWAITIS